VTIRSVLSSPLRSPISSALGGAGGASWEYGARSAVGPVRAILEADSGDVDIVILGDSTSSETTEWGYLLAADLAALYPAFTVNHSFWSDGSQAYGTATEIQSGSGANTLTIWNGSVGGVNTYYMQGLRKTALCTSKSPDLVILSLGHNSPAAEPEYSFKARNLQVIEDIREVLTAVPILMIAQNPLTNSTLSTDRASWKRDLREQMGYGLIDINANFLAYGSSWADDLMADTTHPNDTGSRRWADAMIALFGSSATPLSQTPPAFSVVGDNLLANADFSAFAGALPDGWTAPGSPTVTKDTTNYETGSWAVSVVTTGTLGFLRQDLSSSGLTGKYLTLSARGYRPSASASRITAGRIGIVTDAGDAITPSRTGQAEGFWWECITYLIPDAATYVRAYLYGDTANGTGYETVWDRVSLVVGKTPRDQQ
jgi:lysophospholipase L1-like esterase